MITHHRHEVSARPGCCLKDPINEAGMLKRLVEGLQAEVQTLRLEKEQDYGKFSGDMADHG
jgi:hypothetical protein